MTMGGGRVEEPAAGGPARHIPVLLAEVLAAIEVTPGDLVVDGTFGAGGYSRALLKAGARVVAIDRDPTAIAGGAMLASDEPRLSLVEGRFGDLDAILEGRGLAADAVVLDIGVSSMQIDEAARGFSFQKDGPLDMRMAASGPTAADVVNRLKVGDLARIFAFLGEERHAGRVARAIEARRAERPFETTLDLAQVIGRAVGRSPKDKIDPATRSFQGLRIFVNDELGELARGLLAAERVLKPGGRLVVVTFHSLEDRIVKRFFRDRSGTAAASRHLPDVAVEAPTFEARNRALAASDAEASANPRARSAKLRVGIRTATPPRRSASPLDFADLPALADRPETGA
ncbi:16S rRNA (cytosine(1402)-N(4))-methyltransferase RsmH [Aurantimonas sp. Leaf443]|uniref:16S rRNA (cytosine(1402)-N(4))-methyltransferase RsmH n=1 Tax=Aurantimonas sp. Leaf443 TaxID=1736378 RepID=UPI0006FF6174|nr:16S rRNA (cytosine(1402)-N(4))-methyltransferase RsmH [Aurantimonas sp. Leaf443]KQT88336.1 ribosomal RNA small subunit methyltransferase H [Aurantimonas sp. Leaf443]